MPTKRAWAAGAATLAIVLGASAAEAKIEIQWWFALSGPLGEKTAKLAADFNASQNEYEVKAIYKGSYAETMTGAIAAFRARQHPHIVQVFEVGTATMMAAQGAVYPVYQLMAEAGEPFDPKSYLPAVVGYYTTAKGEMLSFPFNSSTPVMYYNKNAFEKAGLDPNKPPVTWPEVEEAAKKLLAAGYPCGFTTQWPSWIQVENWSAWHNQPLGTLANGFGGLGTELVINKTKLVDHVKALGEWQKTKIFDYGGRRGDSDPKFFNQQCPIFFASSAAYAAVKANAKDFAWGMGMLPYWPQIEGAPQNSIIGGASLWVLRGHKPEEYKGVAKFFSYLSSPEVQARWHQETGYLPITPAAWELTKQQGFYEKNPGTDISIRQITNKPPTENSKGLRFGSFVQIRDIIEEELEAVFQGKKNAQEALDSAARRGNELLRQFEKANS
ncbi:MAG: sn-glycerol-3-phosphate ABC transporter substrate-binding protein UgpB [Geminicoccaceae bacterium]|nr:sn-glycerol-3-phosphate ABC transporter substrate-binding protein UgpB [Geminicoccaceae bacterium]MDW8369381.1 sn-glycerol-3-phosphate ABC transporter substrate-binding protein UgpB [Geminicoccaceae bacterium]